MSHRNRRQFFQALLASGATVLPGCSAITADGDGDGADERGGEADAHPDLRLDSVVLSSAFPFELVEPATGELVAHVHWHGEHSHWHYMPLELPQSGTRTLRAKVLDDERDELALGGSEPYRLRATLTEDSPDALLSVDVSRDVVGFDGSSPAEGQIVFDLLELGNLAWRSPPLTVVVASG